MQLLPEVTARVYNEVADGFLALFFLEQRVVAAEEFHRQSVVGDVEHGAQLVAQVDGRDAGVRRCGHLLLGVLVAGVCLRLPVIGELRVEVLTLDGRAHSRPVVEATPAGSSRRVTAESGIRPRVHVSAEAAV